MWQNFRILKNWKFDASPYAYLVDLPYAPVCHSRFAMHPDYHERAHYDACASSSAGLGPVSPAGLG